jgi:hypothetical protein
MIMKGIRTVASVRNSYRLNDKTVSAAVMLAFLPNSAFAAINFTNTDQVLGDASSYTADIAMADLDGDGDQDIYEAMSQTSGYQPAADRVWLNDGNGIFSDSGQQLGPVWDSAVALADMDGDGDVDAVVADAASSPSVNVYFNDGHGQFDDSGYPMGGEHVRAIAVGDVDGDGDKDVVCGNNVTVSVMLNDGTGQLADSGQQIGDGYSNSVSLADVDGDGDLDIVNGADSLFNNYTTPAVNTIWLNNGAGQYTLSASNIGDMDVSDILLGDLDGDGDLDAFSATNDGVNPGQIWSNDGSGSFTLTSTFISGQTNSSPISASAFSDVDGDDDLDIVLFGYEFRIYENQGGMSFQVAQVIDSTKTSNSITMVDVDDDNDPDLVSSSSFASDEVYLNEPATDTTSSSSTTTTTDASSSTSTDTSGSGGGGTVDPVSLLLAFMSLFVMAFSRRRVCYENVMKSKQPRV